MIDRSINQIESTVLTTSNDDPLPREVATSDSNALSRVSPRQPQGHAPRTRDPNARRKSRGSAPETPIARISSAAMTAGAVSACLLVEYGSDDRYIDISLFAVGVDRKHAKFVI